MTCIKKELAGFASRTILNGKQKLVFNRLNDEPGFIGPGWVPVPSESSYPAPIHEALRPRTPLWRPGTTEEVGELAAFLVSDRTSWLTGQVIYLDGRLTCMLNVPSRVRDMALFGFV